MDDDDLTAPGNFLAGSADVITVAPVAGEPSLPQLWKDCVEALENQYEEEEISTWIRPLQAASLNGSFLLYAPNSFIQKKVEKKFLPSIKHYVSKSIGDCSVYIRVGSLEAAGTAVKGTPAPAGRRGPAIDPGLDLQYRFSNFVCGTSYQVSHSAARQVAEKPGRGAYNPLLIYGSSGLGKTHLLQAIGNEIRQNMPQKKLLYIHSDTYIRNWISALRANKIDEFKAIHRSFDVLLIDDIYFFADKMKLQEDLFHTINAMLHGDGQLVMTSDRYPKNIDGISDRLKTRMNWGLAVCIDPPDLETRVAILQQKAEERKLKLTEEVAFYIARKINSNVRELEGALSRLSIHQEVHGKTISVDMAQACLSDLISSNNRRLSIDQVLNVVCQHYGLNRDQIASKTRTRHIARARQMAMALLKELTSHSLPHIGRFIGNRDHSTVLHACRKIKELRREFPEIEGDYTHIKRRLLD